MNDPSELLGPAIASCELVPEVPRSHRESWLGGAVTLAKRVVVALIPGSLFAAQRAFNRALLQQVRRSSVERTALDLLKHTPVHRWLAPAWSRQREWNHAAIELAVSACNPGVSLDQLHLLLARAAELGRVQATFPLSFELFRQQQVFNLSIVRALGAMRGLPRAGDDGRSSYPQALAAHEARRQAEVLAQLKRRPLISVITPVFRTPLAAIAACIDSVLAQSYDNWELCLVDDASGDGELSALLERYAKMDRRIRLHFEAVNGGIARATNVALGLAAGDFVAFLDHDDTLASHALAEVALRLQNAPATEVLYSDEDKLDPAGRRCLPFFKPDWSPDLLRACNYACHFLVARRSLVEEVGRLREGFDGAQDYDLILRLSERAREIGHIPEVLYHWRIGPQSTALDVANKPGATAAGIRALSEHLRRRGEKGEVLSPAPTNYRVRHALPNEPAVALVISGSTPGSPLLSSLARTRYANRTLISGSPSEAAWRTAAVCVFLDEQLSILDPDWLHELVGQALRPEIGVVGPKLLYPDSTIAEAGWVLDGPAPPIRPFAHLLDNGQWTSMGLADWTRNCLALSPQCVAVRSEVLELLGIPVGSPPRDLCARAVQAGLRILYTPHSRLVLLGASLARGGGAQANPVAARDPYFNPHLSPIGNGALALQG